MGPMIQTSTLQYKSQVNIEIIEVTALSFILMIVRYCEVLIPSYKNWNSPL